VTEHRIAVVGSGPRGMMVVERLAARLTAERAEAPVVLYLIDAVEVGAGRVYRSNQPEWFLMNTVAGQISAFSGLPDAGPARAGAGPALVEWWESADPDCPGPDSYAPRAVYGRYLRFVLDAVQNGLPANARLRRVNARVADLQPDDGGYRLELSDGEILHVDRVVLTTGHSVPELSRRAAELAAFAADRPAVRYVRGDSPADMPLDEVLPGTPVGVIGLGLSFFDVMAAFTVGRGGRFAEEGNGDLRYLPSGREPVLVAGSRSGMPLPARGRNQKPPAYSYQPALFTPEHVRRGIFNRRLDFRADILPWLLAEVELVHCQTLLRRTYGADVAARFRAEVATRATTGGPVPDVRAVAERFGIRDQPVIDLDALARPFDGRTFTSRAAFEQELAAALREDLAHAAEGNVDSPTKAALDVLRDNRWVIRQLVDFSGLNPASHQDDFLGWYVPRSAFLAAGPPEVRLRQVLALIDAGVLRIIGPGAEFAGDTGSGRFVVSSAAVAGAEVPVDVLIDARIPYPDLRRDLSPLTTRLRSRGIWTGYVNRDQAAAFDTGGVAVTASPYHPVDRHGQADSGLYVLGIPTEHTRWFMQVGSCRPGKWSDFITDADDIAAHSLAPVTETAPRPVSTPVTADAP
jgi:hypothetical protein